MPPPHHSRTTPMSGWALASIIILAVLLGVSIFLALRCGICHKIMNRRRKPKNDRLISTIHSEETHVDSDDQVVDIHDFTMEGHTLSFAVIPAAVPESTPDQSGHAAVHHNPHRDIKSELSDGADMRSISESATTRRQYLESELRRTQEQMLDIDSLATRGSPATARMSLATMLGSPIGDSSQEMAALLKAARDRNAALTARIEALESQMQSSWALGLSDEAPPGYTLSASS
ncbi:hypothetical protein DFH07DRAFT_1059404 [Mycena maculata]|uniref:Uncharacterized protein n=1 Tax=Mycena maculata TaxID=230809 RepID=A0AAD7JFG2_9AGAR|nr:hypothetical protein DFH07DRAFT_1059404 [Mycena maculata]